MARKQQIKGLFVAVELDQSELTKSVKSAVTTLETEFKSAKSTIDEALKLDTGAIENKLSSVVKAINRIQNAVQTKTGGEAFAESVKGSEVLKDSLERVATSAGTTSEVLQNVFSKAIKANQVKETVSAVTSLAKSLNLTGDEVVQYAKDLGVTGEALDKIVAKHEKAAVQVKDTLSSVASEIAKFTGKDIPLSSEDTEKAKAIENTQKLVRSFREYVQLMDLSDEQAIEHAKKLGIVGTALDKITEKYTKVTSTAETQLKDLVSSISELTGVQTDISPAEVSKAFEVDKTKQLVDLIEKYRVAIGLSNDEVIEHAQKLGVAGSALEKLQAKYTVFTNSVDKQLEDTAKELAKLTGKDLGLSDKEIIRATEVAKTKQMVEHVNKFARMLDLSTEETVELARQLGFTEAQMGKLVKHSEKLEQHSHGFLFGLKNLMTGGNAMAALQSSLATLGANISVAGFTELGKSMVDTSIKVDSLRTAFTSIYKDADKAGMQLDYIRSVTDELGLEFYSTAEAAKGFFAAAETSTIKNNAEEIFHAVSAASSALKLSQEQTNGVFLAISQMMSKGKISAEEMRQQLAERLPGAVQLLAESMGVTLQKLDKMFESGEVGIENLVKLAEKVEEVYGEAGAKASKALLGELNKLKSAWTDFKTEFIEQEVITDWVKKAQGVVAWLKDNIDVLRKSVNSLVVAYLAFLALKGSVIFKEIAVFAGESVVAIRNLIKGTTTLKAAMVALSGAMSTATLGISALVGVIAYVWQTQKEEFDAAKYSIDDIRGSISATTNVMSELGEAVKSTDDRLKDLAKRKLELNVINAEEKLKKVRNSLDEIINAANSYANSESFVKKVLPENAKEDDIFANLEKVKNSREIFSTAVTNLGKIKQAIDENRISDEQAIAQLKEQENLYKSLGFEGTQAYTDLQAYITQFISAMKGASDAIQTQEQGLKDLASTAGEVLGNGDLIGSVSFNKPKLAIDNMKKEFKKQGDFELAATVDLLTSGELSSGSKKFKADVADIKEYLEIAKDAGMDGAKYLQEVYNLSTEITKEIEKRAQLESQKASSRGLEKYKKMQEDLEGVNERLADFAKLGELGGDSVSYGLYKITARAEKAETELRKTVAKLRDLKGIDQGKVTEFENKSMELISKESLAEQEKYLKSFIDSAKDSYNELREFKGEITSAEIEGIEDEYAKRLEALDAWHTLELKKYEDQSEKKKQIDADYEAYTEALELEKNERILRASDDLVGGLKLGLKDYLNSGKGVAGQMADATLKGFQGMGDALANFVTAADKSWDNLAEGFADLARSIINDMAKIIAQAAVMNSIKWAMDSTPLGGFFGLADGGVVNSGLSSFSNGVYNTPTFFNTNGGGIQRFANGGVFGEAGPEAIMPLTRMPNGRLGVASTGGGGGGGDVQVNVYNNSNSNAEVRQSTGSGGGKTIDVIIGDVVAKQMSTPGSKLNRTVNTYTGGQQAVTRR